jgi:hypothetical protein
VSSSIDMEKAQGLFEHVDEEELGKVVAKPERSRE